MEYSILLSVLIIGVLLYFAAINPHIIEKNRRRRRYEEEQAKYIKELEEEENKRREKERKEKETERTKTTPSVKTLNVLWKEYHKKFDKYFNTLKLQNFNVRRTLHI